ncbi:tyrosine-protein phosphatase [Sphingobium sp. AN558]|uniref:tyrosine-protein phosphatase n=1 Tax=Sphingobium sp. AN558 TaxID=3133442 RepID=UPI0030C34F6D
MAIDMGACTGTLVRQIVRSTILIFCAIATARGRRIAGGESRQIYHEMSGRKRMMSKVQGTAFPQFEAILNFRDFGGLPTRAGHVRRGMLFRSAAHDISTEADLALIASLNLGLVVDLRRPSERATAPSRWPVNFQARVIENADPEDVEPPHMAAMFGDPSPEAIRQKIIAYYRGAAFDPHHLSVFRAAFEHMAANDAPVLIHCAAGKDRTGLFASLILQALGVSHEDLLADYLLTNSAGLHDRHGPVAETMARAGGLDVLPAESRQAMLAADPAYLAASWESIDERCGSIDVYLETLGLDSARRERLVRLFTE